MVDEPQESDSGSAPTGAQTLMEVLDAAADRGFGHHLVARSSGKVECTACAETSLAATIPVSRVHRLEGASDAADMLLILEARCPRCKRGGTLTLGYGPNASDADTAVVTGLDLSDR